MEFSKIVQLQRDFFASGKTLSYEFRKNQLQNLKLLIALHEESILTALKKDLNKSAAESYIAEIGLILDEIDFALGHLKNWMKPKKVSTPFPLFWPAKSFIQYEPYGCALILSPWNYPFFLIMSPLIGAIAAGNCVILKPSEISSYTQNVVVDLINNHFPAHYITAIKANAENTDKLLKEKFDYLFFTGGTRVGKLVMQAAADHLTPLTLELGGKSPCIVDETIDLEYAARRIIWGKLMNAGQTCVAPDYLLVHSTCKSQLIENLKKAIIQFYGKNPAINSDYGKIINEKHFDYLVSLMQKGNIVFGGETNKEKLFIAPTLIDNVSFEDPIMQNEIFGPLLPILTFETTDELVHLLKPLAKPLSLYLFTNNKEREKIILQQLSFGGGCINDCMMHVGNIHLPFGGVGLSGMGNYHGKYSFETFSHKKSIYKKRFLIDVSLQYPPYTDKKYKWIRRIFNWHRRVSS